MEEISNLLYFDTDLSNAGEKNQFSPTAVCRNSQTDHLSYHMLTCYDVTPPTGPARTTSTVKETEAGSN